MVGQKRTSIARLGFLRALQGLGEDSRPELILGFLRAVGIAVGIAASLSYATAETETLPVQDEFISSYNLSAQIGDLATNLFENNHEGISNIGNRDRFGELLIPETVQSFDLSAGVDSDYIPGGYESDLDLILNLGTKTTYPEIGDVGASSLEENSYGYFDIWLFSALPFQTASCHTTFGRTDSAFCNSDSMNKYDSGAEKTETNDDNDTLILSNTSSVSIEGTTPAGINDLPPLVPAGFNDYALQDNLTDAITTDQCNDAFVWCATVLTVGTDQINLAIAPLAITPLAIMPLAIAPIGSPITPIVPSTVLSDSPPVIFGNPGPSLLAPPPPPVASSIPETPTGVMIMIGLSIMVVPRVRKALHFIRKKRAVAILLQSKKTNMTA
jgi:hypothetical protein